jgi:hypothetical protein
MISVISGEETKPEIYDSPSPANAPRFRYGGYGSSSAEARKGNF